MPSSHSPDGLSHSACRAKVRAHQSAEALIVGAPEELRAELRGLGTKQQVRRCARLRDFWPMAGWRTAAPAEQGMDPAMVGELDAKVPGSYRRSAAC
jgi:hypothetical protein